MESVLNNLIGLISDNSSALFGGIGAIFGFYSNSILKKMDYNNDIKKEEAKDYLKKQISIFNILLKLNSEYKVKSETLFEFIEDENGIPIKKAIKEDIYEIYFLKVFNIIDENQFYLTDNILTMTNKIRKEYHKHILSMKVNQTEDTDKTNQKLKEILMTDTTKNFNLLLKVIVSEHTNIKEKLGIIK